MNKKKWFLLPIFIVVIEGLGYLSAVLSGDVGKKYAALELPPLAPPGKVFGIVWPILYLLLAISLYLVVTSRRAERRLAVRPFIAAMALNFIWSPLFFGLGLFWAAALVIILMDFVTAMTLRAFARVKAASAWLLAPYLLWLLFATYLNISIAMLN
ncbi:MAG: tryptophan-rich sensory protein [Oscillospiraceae bacterium]|nr:tryptophan-rich sensory protein [Oscillospiraceae bacterium]